MYDVIKLEHLTKYTTIWIIVFITFFNMNTLKLFLVFKNVVRLKYNYETKRTKLYL